MDIYSAAIEELERHRSDIDTALNVLRSLYGLKSNGHPEAAAATGKERRKQIHRDLHTQKTALRQDAQPSPERESTGRESPVQDAILATLKQRAMTSIEVFDELKKSGSNTTAGSVYNTLRNMFSKGVLVKGQNDVGTVTWKLNFPAALHKALGQR